MAIVAVAWLACCSWPAMAQIRYHVPEDEVPDEPAPEQASWGSIGIGGLGQDVEGNRRRFEQYYTPPLGAYPSTVRIEGASRGGAMMSQLDLRDISEPGRSAAVAVQNTNSLVEFDADHRNGDTSAISRYLAVMRDSRQPSRTSPFHYGHGMVQRESSCCTADRTE